MLKDVYIKLVLTYLSDKPLSISLWNEIKKKYTGRKRHYHNLTHLEALINQLTECRSIINDWETILFSVFYHDIIYNVLKKDNEEKSAELAVKRLSQIRFPLKRIEQCEQQILATKAHTRRDNSDTNLFTDADLSILGQPESTYREYCLQIRKEYSIYPDLIYKPGRKKVVEHFLQMPRIFKTDFFFDKYEQQTRQNLQEELTSF